MQEKKEKNRPMTHNLIIPKNEAKANARNHKTAIIYADYPHLSIRSSSYSASAD
jgi:hypothetical protein